MTRIRYVLPIIVLAALTAPASAAQVTLTDTWQSLGTGPLLLQTQGGDGLFEASASAPTDNGLALGKNQTPFGYNSTLTIWGKRRSQARNNAGANINTTVTSSPLTLASGGSGGSGGSAADQTATNASDAQATRSDNQHDISFPYLFNGTTFDRWYGTVAGGARVNVTNFPSVQPISGTVTAAQSNGTTYAVSWTGQTVAATQSGAYTVTQGPAGTAAWKVDGSAVTQPVSGSVSVLNFPTTQAVSGTVTSNQGTPAAVANAWPHYLVQGGAALSTTNGLPTTDTNAASTIAAPGTAASKAQTVQGAAGATPISTTPTNAATVATAANQFALSYQLLNNATATGATFTAVGGNYLLALSGTFGGATVTVTSTTNGVTTTLGTYTAAPATPPQFTIATGAVVQATVSGGTPSALYATLGGIGAATTATASGAASSTITSTQGAVTNPADIAVAANTVTPLLSTTTRKFMSLTNVGTGNCRVAYNGITPTTTRGDPLNAATAAGLGGGSRTFEASYVPSGTVSAICATASSFSVIEGQ